MAGITATLVCFPLDVIRTRMLVPSHQCSLAKTVVDMLCHEGPGAFYTGCVPALVSMALGGAVFYGTYDLLKTRALRKKGIEPFPTEGGAKPVLLDPATTLASGALAGMIAELVTYPFEVVRRKMQLQRSMAQRVVMGSSPASATLTKVKFSQRLLSAIQMSTQQHGIRGLYAGMMPNMLQVLPSAALGYFVYEVMKVVLDVRA